MPDHIVLPVGNGSLYLGAWMGFKELAQTGRLSGMPRLHPVQARAVMPIVAAQDGGPWGPADAGATMAVGIASASPPRIDQIIAVLRASRGVAVAVEEGEILRWRRLLATNEGIFAEPTSAAAFAGLAELVRRGVIGGDDTVLVPITGSGLKDDTPP
jgi:threonine synthase